MASNARIKVPAQKHAEHPPEVVLVPLDAHGLRSDLAEFGSVYDTRQFLRVLERVNRIKTVPENQGRDPHGGPRLTVRMRSIHNEALEFNGGVVCAPSM